MVKYIHLNSILKFIKEVEGIDFQVINSENYGITGVTSFKVIIPKSFDVEKVELVEDFDSFTLFNVKVLNKSGEDAMVGSNIFLWNSELYSTKTEKSICVSDDAIDNGMLIFENFKNIPPFVDSLEIIRHI